MPVNAGSNTIQGWASRNLEVLWGPKLGGTGLFVLELYVADQIRMARKRFAKSGGEDVTRMDVHAEDYG